MRKPWGRGSCMQLAAMENISCLLLLLLLLVVPPPPPSTLYKNVGYMFWHSYSNRPLKMHRMQTHCPDNGPDNERV